MPDFTPDNASNKAIEMIAIQTAAANSDPFYVYENNGFTIFCDALGASEVIALEAQRPDDTWITVIPNLLIATLPSSGFFSKGLYRIAKPLTASAVGVYAFNVSFNQRGR